jgi:hypothetical protein
MQNELLINFRKRLTQYRNYKLSQGLNASIHINAMEIALSLCEYSIEIDRKIQKEELTWFEAGWHLEHVIGGSEWQDLLHFYNRLSEEIVIHYLED